MRGYLFIKKEKRRKFIDVCFDAYWKNNVDISQQENIKKILIECEIDQNSFEKGIKDQKIKAYSKIEAVKTLFQIIDKGVIDRQQAEQLNELKEMVNALEGNNKVIEVN